MENKLVNGKPVVNPDESLAELIHQERIAIKKLNSLKVNGTPMVEIETARTEYNIIRGKRLVVEKAMSNGGIVRLF
jgi:hypothetical protein